VPKTFTNDEAVYMTQSAMHHWLSIDCWRCELRSDKNSYRRPCSVDRTVGDAPANVCLWWPSGWTNMPKRREQKRIWLYAVVYLKLKQLIIKTALEVLYWSYTDTKHHAASLRQQSFLFSLTYKLTKIVIVTVSVCYIINVDCVSFVRFKISG